MRVSLDKDARMIAIIFAAFRQLSYSEKKDIVRSLGIYASIDR